MQLTVAPAQSNPSASYYKPWEVYMTGEFGTQIVHRYAHKSNAVRAARGIARGQNISPEVVRAANGADLLIRTSDNSFAVRHYTRTNSANRGLARFLHNLEDLNEFTVIRKPLS